MTLILIRHAHRDTRVRQADNGLSVKGRNQAKALRDYFQSRFPKRSEERAVVLLYSSPKRRCVETLRPIAREGKKEIHLSDLLEEQAESETTQNFRRRIEMFLRTVIQQPKPCILCSHGDWLPIALQILCGAQAELGKGSWAEIEFNAQGPRLTRILQPDDLKR